MKKLFSISISLFPLCLMAQHVYHWKACKKINDSLPISMRAYYTTDSIDGHQFRAFYVSVDLSDKDIVAEVQTSDGDRITPKTYVKRNNKKVYAIINGSFFSFKTQRNLNLVISNGKLIDPNKNADSALDFEGNKTLIYPTNGAFGLSTSGKPDIAWVYSFGDKTYAFNKPNFPVNGKWTPPSKREGFKWNVEQAVGGGPVLLPFVSSVQENKFAWHENNLEPRTAIGYKKDGTIILLAVEGRHLGVAMGASLPELARIFKQLNCVEALNLDGGGSSCMLINGEETIRPSSKGIERPVPSVFVIKAR